MTFLLDHDVPDDVIFGLIALKNEVVRLRDVLPSTAPDADVLSHAYLKRWILITCNRDDFLALARDQRHSGTIILVRRPTQKRERAALIRLIDRAGEGGLVNNVNFA